MEGRIGHKTAEKDPTEQRLQEMVINRDRFRR